MTDGRIPAKGKGRPQREAPALAVRRPKAARTDGGNGIRSSRGRPRRAAMSRFGPAAMPSLETPGTTPAVKQRT